MSARVCYIQREDRGAVLRRLRVIGGKTDDAWDAPATEAGAIGNQTVASAASWVADRLSGRLGGRVLDRLCLDPDGGVCTWVTSNSADPRMVRAVIEQEGRGEGDELFAEAAQTEAGRFPDLPGEVGYQPLAAGRSAEAGPSRTPVLAVPDVAARALLDALDEQGVQVGSCVSIWQAMVAAWAAPQGGSSDNRFIDSGDRPVFAVVLCTPGDRVIWAWGRDEDTIAAGSFRTRLGARQTSGLMLGEGGDGDDEGGPAPISDGGAAALRGRLATEWIAWSAQLGVVPRRVVWVGPIGSSESSADGSSAGLDAAAISAALRGAAPGATVDAVDEADPVGLTLRRLAENIEEGAAGSKPGADGRLVGLSNRPGRAHRGMYTWLALLFIAASVVMGAFAWTFWERRDEATAALAAVRSNQRELLEQGAPDLVNDRLALMNLRSKVQQKAGPAPVSVPPPKPVLRELETLAFVLGNPDYELLEIDLGTISVTFRVRVDGTVAYEQLEQSLFGIAGSSVIWSTPLSTRPTGDKITVTGTGVWSVPTGGSQSSIAPTRPGVPPRGRP